MKVKVDKDLCIGCGLCSSMCSNVFYTDENGKSSVNENVDISSNIDSINNCISSCPVSCITLEED